MNIVSIFEQFPSQADCIAHLEAVRWPDGPVCPYCGSINATPRPKEHRHHCNGCNTTFSVAVRTIFHHTHLPLQKWFLAIALTLNAKKGLSARQLARDLSINKNTAWRIAMQIRKAMSQTEQRELLAGLVEVDECYIGGKPRKGRPDYRTTRGRGTRKTPVVGMVERGGRVKAEAVKKTDLTAKRLSALVRRNVDIVNATLITDEFHGYIGIKRFMPHETVKHRIWYVDSYRHTNTIESFWAILKRGFVGQYHKVSLRYLPCYIDEFCYRFNHRKNDDVFNLTIRRAVGVNT